MQNHIITYTIEGYSKSQYPQDQEYRHIISNVKHGELIKRTKSFIESQDALYSKIEGAPVTCKIVCFPTPTEMETFMDEGA